MSKLESFNILPEAEYAVAQMLYQTGVSLECKIFSKPRALKNQPPGFRIIFNIRSANTVLFWMQMMDGALHVKANLFYISEYFDKMPPYSDAIKKFITGTKECSFCELCPPRPPYAIDGKSYNPCGFHGHYFTRMSREDWLTLRDLIVLEHDTPRAPYTPPPAPDRPVQGKKYHGFYTK